MLNQRDPIKRVLTICGDVRREHSRFLLSRKERPHFLLVLLGLPSRIHGIEVQSCEIDQNIFMF